MHKEQRVAVSEELGPSKSRESRHERGINKAARPMLLAAMVVAAMGALWYLPAAATAEVQFDGKEWFLSQRSKFVRVTDEGYLEWAAPGEQQLIARLPEMQLGQIGDIAEVRYLYKADGNPKQQSQCCNHHKGSDTGNLRIGLFDSNGKGHIEDDGYGCENDIWKGYLGYYADVSPHISEDAKHGTAEGKLNLPGKMVKRTSPDRPTLLDESPGCQVDRHIGGFGAPLGQFVPLFLKLKRTGPNTVHVAVTVDNATYLWIEEDASIRPHKIDVVSIGFAGQSPYTKVTLAPISAAKSLLKTPLRP
ncbi:MAG: hypothetical protein ACYSUV_08680, partial [Planctomycetota bacterium]